MIASRSPGGHGRRGLRDVFQRRPYRRWFDPLDELLRTGADASYDDGSACHLDLVQWPRSPCGARSPTRESARRCWTTGCSTCGPNWHGRTSASSLLNGREVLDQVVAVRLADLDEVGHLPLAGGTCRLYAGTGGGIRWVAWSTNLQSSWGVSKAFKQDLAAWLAEICPPPTEPRVPAASVPTPELELDADGHPPRGLRVAGRPNS